METITLPHLPSSTLHIGLFIEVTNASFLRQQLLDGNRDFEYTFLDAACLVSRSQVLAACFSAIHDANSGRLKTRNIHSEVVFALSPTNNIAESFRRFGLSDTTTSLVAIKITATSSPDKSSSTAKTEETSSPTSKTEDESFTRPKTEDTSASLTSSSRDSAIKEQILSNGRTTSEEVFRHLFANITGKYIPLTDENLADRTDWARIRKYYKLVEPPKISSSSKTAKPTSTIESQNDETKKVQDGSGRPLVDPAMSKWRREAEMYILGSMAIKGS